MPPSRPLALLVTLAPLAIACATSAPLATTPPAAGTASAASTAAAPAPALVTAPAGCEALVKPLRALVGLSEEAKLAMMGELKPAHPEQMAAELDADAAAIRASKPADAELSQLGDDAATLLTALAGKARAYAKASASKRDAEILTAHDAFVRAAESADVLLAVGHRRCGTADPTSKPMGRLSMKVVKLAFGGGFRAFEACFTDGLRRDPALAGRVVVHLIVGQTGQVVEATTVEQALTEALAWTGGAEAPFTQMADPRVTTCVVTESRKLIFPPPDGGPAAVTYPLTFGRAD